MTDERIIVMENTEELKIEREASNMEIIKGFVKGFINEERGDLSTLAAKLGLGVVTVVIVVALIALAPGTATDLWNSFVTYVKGALGL